MKVINSRHISADSDIQLDAIYCYLTIYIGKISLVQYIPTVSRLVETGKIPT